MLRFEPPSCKQPSYRLHATREVDSRTTVESWHIRSDVTTSTGNNRKKKEVNSKAQMFRNHSVLTACFIVINVRSTRGTSSGATAVRPPTSTGCLHRPSRTLESFHLHRQRHCDRQRIAIATVIVIAFANATPALVPRISRFGPATPTHTDNDTSSLSIVETLSWPPLNLVFSFFPAHLQNEWETQERAHDKDDTMASPPPRPPRHQQQQQHHYTPIFTSTNASVTLDLHSHQRDEAKPRIASFLDQSILPRNLIVTGTGQTQPRWPRVVGPCGQSVITTADATNSCIHTQ